MSEQKLSLISILKNSKSDAATSISGSIFGGSIIDYFSGFTLMQSLGARATGAGLNIFLGPAYGLWRDKVFEKMGEKPGFVNKYIREFAAYNSFNGPLYALSSIGGMLLAREGVEFDKVANGVKFLAEVSLLSAPIFGFYLDKGRELINKSNSD